MKKTLLIVTIAALMCLLSACSFGGGGTTTTTTAAPQGDGLPSLTELEAAMQSASPARARIAITSRHEGLGELESTAYLLVTEEAAYYYYETERFLPLAEALATGETVERRSGYLLMEGDSIKAASDEIDNALLGQMQAYSIRTPSLRADFLKRYEILREGESVILTAVIADDAAALAFDEHLAGAKSLTLTLTFRESDLTPTAFSIDMITEDGIPTRYAATYSYTAAPLPTITEAPTPDLSLWE